MQQLLARKQLSILKKNLVVNLKKNIYMDDKYIKFFYLSF